MLPRPVSLAELLTLGYLSDGDGPLADVHALVGELARERARARVPRQDHAERRGENKNGEHF